MVIFSSTNTADHSAKLRLVLRRAYATDNGNSDEIRENLRLALSKRDAVIYDPAEENQNFELVRLTDDDTIEPL